MHHRGGASAEWRRLKSAPPVAFNRVRRNLMKGELNIPAGAVPPCSQSLFRRRSEHPGGGPGVWTAQGHGAQEVQVLGASRVSEREATPATETGSIQGDNGSYPGGRM